MLILVHEKGHKLIMSCHSLEKEMGGEEISKEKQGKR